MGHGQDTKPVPMVGIGDQWRFWIKVDIKGPDDCWLWLAGKFSDGYGSFSLFRAGNFKAQRVAYRIANNKDPGKFIVGHTCNKPSCVNPKHLELDTVLGNVLYSHMCGRHDQKGERHPSHTLYDSEVEEIRNSNLTGRELSKLYCVSEGHISSILKGRKRS